MIKVSSPKDSNKSKKHKVIHDSYLACAQKDLETFGSLVTEDYELEIVGETNIYGWDNAKEYIIKKVRIPDKLIINQIVTYGKYASAHGRFIYDTYEIAYGNFYEFASVSSNKIKKVSVYTIVMNR